MHIAELWTGSEPASYDPATNTFGFSSSASVDQAIAANIGRTTPFRSLEFGVQTAVPSFGGHRMIYLGSEQPLAPENDPFAMFERIFTDGNLDTEAAALRKLQRLAVIDLVKPELDAMLGRISQTDRLKVEAHLDAIDQMEKQLQSSHTCEPPDIGTPVDLNSFLQTEEISRKQLALIAQAFACGATNVASVMYRQAENDHYPYSFLGIEEEHHNISHVNLSYEPATSNKVAIYRWYASQIAYLAGLLDSIIESDGSTVLDNTIILWGSEVAQGHTHAEYDLPFVVLGGGGGALNTGRFLQFEGALHNRLLVTLCQAFGLAVDTFGNLDNGSGPLAGMLA